MISFCFLISWILCILLNILFFLQIDRLEKKYDLVIERYIGNRILKIKKLKGLRSMILDKKIIREINISLLFLYSSRIFFVAPILIFFCEAIFSK